MKNKMALSVSLNLMALLCLFQSTTAHADADKKESLKELTALMINLNGHPCATVTDISPMRIKDTYEVTCIANRGGKAKKTYIFNAVKGTASEL